MLFDLGPEALSTTHESALPTNEDGYPERICTAARVPTETMNLPRRCEDPPGRVGGVGLRAFLRGRNTRAAIRVCGKDCEMTLLSRCSGCTHVPLPKRRRIPQTT